MLVKKESPPKITHTKLRERGETAMITIKSIVNASRNASTTGRRVEPTTIVLIAHGFLHCYYCYYNYIHTIYIQYIFTTITCVHMCDRCK